MNVGEDLEKLETLCTIYQSRNAGEENFVGTRTRIAIPELKLMNCWKLSGTSLRVQNSKGAQSWQRLPHFYDFYYQKPYQVLTVISEKSPHFLAGEREEESHLNMPRTFCSS